MANVSPLDWICLALGVFGALATCLSQKDRLPASVRAYFSAVSVTEIMDAVERVQSVKSMTSAGRREYVAEFIAKVCLQRLGITVPRSIANLMTEYVYRLWREIRR